MYLKVIQFNCIAHPFCASFFAWLARARTRTSSELSRFSMKTDLFSLLLHTKENHWKLTTRTYVFSTIVDSVWIDHLTYGYHYSLFLSYLTNDWHFSNSSIIYKNSCGQTDFSSNNQCVSLGKLSNSLWLYKMCKHELTKTMTFQDIMFTFYIFLIHSPR